jgi:hypothetical protein
MHIVELTGEARSIINDPAPSDDADDMDMMVQLP